MSYLQNINVRLPNGSVGSLLSFYESTMSGDVEVSDEGFILSDGTVIPTNGEPLYGASEEEMEILMEDYIIRNSRDIPNEIDNTKKLKPKVSTMSGNYTKLLIIVLGAYLIFRGK